jgi:tetratricopeptide (TPR) repeat protein
MNSQQVEIYLEAENDVANKNYVEAFRKYESILFDEPGNAATHNSLGWIYKTQMDNYTKAENHYKAAINGDPSYPHSYLNYMILLMDLERYVDIQALAKRAGKVEAVDKSWVQHRLGLVEELQLHFDQAIILFEKAILYTLNDEKIKGYKEDIARCEEKRELLVKH